jgi:hypothetical protein
MAVTPISSKYCCITTQQMLSDITRENTPDFVRIKRNGFLNAVTSAENTSGFEVVKTSDSRGKALPGVGNRTVEIKYRKQLCPTITAAAADMCDASADIPDDWEYSGVSVDCVQSVAFGLSKEEFRQLCEEPNDRMARLMRDYVSTLREAVNNDLITKYIAGLGLYFNGDDSANPLEVRTLFPFNTSGQTNAQFLQPLMADWRKSNWSGDPIVVYGDMVSRFLGDRDIFVGDNDGKDATRAGFPPGFLDYEVDNVFADTFQHIISWVPGFIQMTEWDRYVGVYEEFKEDYSRTQLTMDGFTFDYTIRYIECDERWVVTMTKYYDLFKMPDEALSSACGQLSNGCLNWLVDCGDIDCNYVKL